MTPTSYKVAIAACLGLGLADLAVINLHLGPEMIAHGGRFAAPDRTNQVAEAPRRSEAPRAGAAPRAADTEIPREPPAHPKEAPPELTRAQPVPSVPSVATVAKQAAPTPASADDAAEILVRFGTGESGFGQEAA